MDSAIENYLQRGCFDPHASRLETFLQHKVFLGLRVSVKDQWREDERMLDQLGMQDRDKWLATTLE